MPFEIPNEAAASFPDQAEPDAVDFAILVAALKGDYVVSGCLVTAQGTPDMTVAVASGVVRINGASVAVSDGNVTIAAADATNPRFDLIAIDDAGVKSRVAGTASSNPVFPAIPANSIIIASVYVPANDTDIDANQIVDKRVIGGFPGGSDTQVQFNDGGVFSGDAGFTYNKTTDVLSTSSVYVTDELLISQEPGNPEEKFIEITENELALIAAIGDGEAHAAPILSFKPTYDPGGGAVYKFIDVRGEIDDVSGVISFILKMDVSEVDFIFDEIGAFYAVSPTGSVSLGSTVFPWARLFLSQYIEMVEMTAPSAPAANGVLIYPEDNGAGKTRLMALFSSGAAQQIAIQP